MLPILKHNIYLPTFNDEFFGNQLFNSFFGNNEISNTMPSININEDGNCFSIEVAAPGFNKNDFKINLNNSILEISSEKKQNNEHSNKKMHCKEFHYASFSRSFTLPDSVDAEKIKASYIDGILNIELPKREETKTKPKRQIEIQ